MKAGKRNRSCLRETAETAEEKNSQQTLSISLELKHFISSFQIFLHFLHHYLPTCFHPLLFFNCTFHDLVSTCSLHPLDFFPPFHLLFLSLALSLPPSFPADIERFPKLQTGLPFKPHFKTGLSLSLSLQPRYLPIQPTIGLNQACSLCVKNKSSGPHFRVKCDYLTTAFISFLPPFLVPHSLPVVFCSREVRNTSEERVRSC